MISDKPNVLVLAYMNLVYFVDVYEGQVNFIAKLRSSVVQNLMS